VSRSSRAPVRCAPAAYWSLHHADLLTRLESRPEGLRQDEAEIRLRTHGRNELNAREQSSRMSVLGRQLRSPLLLLLIFAVCISVATSSWLDALTVLSIVVATVGVGYSREYSAETAAAALRARLRSRCTVVRDGQAVEVPNDEIVAGDVVLLSAGRLVPADVVLLDATDLFVSEAVLTGESFPSQKRADAVPDASASLVERTNCAFLGSNVRSGTARGVVVATGSGTEFGAIADRLSHKPPETDFDRGLKRFGFLLTSAMLTLVLLVFLAHVLIGRAPIETLLFAVALAVGLSPELLPAILTVNLARGAHAMARRGVLVRRLNAIENLGSMNVLCTDKTGTLTEGVVEVQGAYDAAGGPSKEVLDLAALNASLETGIDSPLDRAITNAHQPDLSAIRKLAEIPFDFTRKRVTVAVATADGARLIAKGAYHHIVEICQYAADGTPLDETSRASLDERYKRWSRAGIRVLAIAIRPVALKADYGRDDECEMRFVGFVTFFDRPKDGTAEAIRKLAALGVAIKVITGDSRLVAQHVARLVGLRAERVVTGQDLDNLHGDALLRVAEQTDLFTDVDPNQKERIILSLRKTGHVVGFLGDGVNDAPAMHAADTSLAVEQAVDVARQTADFVLLERDLDVIRHGIVEGRKTFANTLKYILITTSANLGNMVSMAAASIVLPFLPLTAGQILLNNFLSDIPAVGIADDSVDEELVDRPQRWDIRFIGRYMLVFGMLSSLFDFLTFGVLLAVFRASASLFRTSWFVESLLTELVVALVMRTRRPFFKSRPGRLLLITTMALIPITFAIPYIPGASVFGFVPLPIVLVVTIAVITGMYVAATELTKHIFFVGITRPAGLSRIVWRAG
jgi:Mg2+-importing ATPase